MAYAILYFILVEELKHSLGMVTNTRCNAWVLGDFNYPKFSWNADRNPLFRPRCIFSPDMIFFGSNGGLTHQMWK